MNHNVDIFIGTHCNYKFPDNDIYKIIYNGNEELNTNLKVYHEENEVLHNLFADAYRIDYIFKYITLKEYVGLVQYKRYFEFFNNIPNIDDIFKDYDIIVPSNRQISINNLYDQYVSCHDIISINSLLEILHEKYPEYESTIHQWRNIPYIIPHCMFIMKSNDFRKMHNFLFDIFNEFVVRNNIYTMNDVKLMFNKGINYKVIGFLCERLMTVYFRHNFKKIKYINVIQT